MENFEKASKAKLRFNTSKGQLSVEELWELSLPSLDNIAKAVNRELKATEEESFIDKKTTGNSELQLKLDILKRVIEVKLEDREKAKKRQDNSTRIATLKQMVANKEMEELGAKPSEELKKLLAELEAEE